MTGVVSVQEFATNLMEMANRTVLRSMDGLADDDLYRQPSPDTNSIGWTAWHLSRWKDQLGALLTGEPQAWERDGWAPRFRMDAGRTGAGDTLQQVADFRPERDLLLGYVEAAHTLTLERVQALTDDRLMAEVTYWQGEEPRPVWRALAGTVMDFTQHTGQIAYLRGLISGFGWRDR